MLFTDKCDVNDVAAMMIARAILGPDMYWWHIDADAYSWIDTSMLCEYSDDNSWWYLYELIDNIAERHRQAGLDCIADGMISTAGKIHCIQL